MPNNQYAQALMPVGAARTTPLNEIGFAEFTAKLITDVFNALVSANATQTESYLTLIERVSEDLTAFINNTRDDISGVQLLDFLTKLLPNAATGGTKVVKDGTLSVVDAKSLGQAIAIDGYESTAHTNLVAKLKGAADDLKLADHVNGDSAGPTYFDEILTAAAGRIAADKYTLLKEMVKMGLLRLVVEHGVIETRLTYNTYASTYHAREASTYDTLRRNFSTGGGGGLMSFLMGAPSISCATNSLTVSTSKSTDRDISGSSVQVFGRVQIDFKTDYQPLNT